MSELNSRKKYHEECLKELEREVKNEEEKAEWEEAAVKLHTYYEAMIKAGFTEEQAWWFVTATVRQAWGIS